MALSQGKIDCIIIDEQPAKVFVSNNNDLEILPEEFTNEDYAAVIKKDNTELLEKVNKALSEIKEDGTLVAAIDPATAIGNQPTAVPRSGARYNLSGQRVDNGYRGLIIENGKKRLVKQ